MKVGEGPVYGFTLRAKGLLNEITSPVRISEAYVPKELGVEAPPPPGITIMEFQSIWDTGATCTVISPQVISALGLKPSGKTVVHSVGGGAQADRHDAYTYLVNIYLPNGVAFSGFKVIGASSGTDVLIGMDIVAQGDFAITTFDGNMVWTFRTPSAGEIDFVKEIDEYKRKRDDAASGIVNRKTRRAAAKNKRQK